MVSCVQMRDYTGIKDGAFGLDVKSGFDTGARGKDYHLIGEDAAIIIGDTEREVIFKIGLPARIEMGLDGDECWLYDGRRIELFLRDGRLRDWSFSRYEGDKSK
ncbi:MAG: hypothetical protein ABIE75_05050 [Candidatus Omnitrophota bacterium]